MPKLTMLEVEQLSSVILQGLDKIDMHNTDDDIVLAAIQESIIDYLRSGKPESTLRACTRCTRPMVIATDEHGPEWVHVHSRRMSCDGSY